MFKSTSVKFIVVFLLSCTLLLAGARPMPAQSTLAAGDIAILGLNCDNPDEFAFVLLVDVEAGTLLKFTDNGWLAAGGFRANEGIVLWTAASDYVAGTVIQYSGTSGEFSSVAGSFALATGGEQILAYQGDETSPTFIYALNDSGAATWQADATSSSTSALPTGLTNGITAVAINQNDNAIYTGTTSGSQATLLAAISNFTNWTGSNSTRQIMPTGPFSVLPTAVDLVSFTATARPGSVLLRWETASEVDNLGFNLYRATTARGPRTQINAALIPAQAPGSPVGASYTFLDGMAPAGQTCSYWLEDVDLSGQATLHGPVTATVPLRQRLVPPRPRPVPETPGRIQGQGR